MKRFYLCEDGNDNYIADFESAFGAILFAEDNEKVREIFEYIKTDDEDINVVGLIWKRN